MTGEPRRAAPAPEAEPEVDLGKLVYTASISTKRMLMSFISFLFIAFYFFAFMLRKALIKPSISPSITAPMLPFSKPVRVSLARV